MPIQNLIALFNRLPGIGPKVAERFVYYLLMSGKGEVQRLIQGLEDIIGKIKTCKQCQNFSENSPCEICSDKSRNHETICVVEWPQHMQSIEKTGTYKGIYHILRGVIDETQDIGPDKLKIKELLERKNVKEIILALNPDMDGEATMLYIEQEIKNTGSEIKISRLARGLPLGSDVEYADEITLSDALKNRQTRP